MKIKSGTRNRFGFLPCDWGLGPPSASATQFPSSGLAGTQPGEQPFTGAFTSEKGHLRDKVPSQATSDWFDTKVARACTLSTIHLPRDRQPISATLEPPRKGMRVPRLTTAVARRSKHHLA